MDEAKKLLLAGNLTVSAVAYTVGYLKPGAFTAAFKKHTGMLPRYYRNMQTHERRQEHETERNDFFSKTVSHN
jgi:AraC-like DNA-binding protein